MCSIAGSMDAYYFWMIKTELVSFTISGNSMIRRMRKMCGIALLKLVVYEIIIWRKSES